MPVADPPFRAHTKLTPAREIVSEGFAKPLEAARYLAVSKKWIYELIRVGALTHVRHGRRISIPWVSLREYAASQIERGRIA